MDTFAPASLNWSVRQGDSFVHTHTIKDPTGTVAIDLTGATLTGVLGGTSLTCEVIDPTAGQFQYSLTPAQTAALYVGEHRWSLTCTFADGTVQTFFIGIVEVTA